MSRPSFAKKSLGQNFLVDERYVDRIVRHVLPEAGQTIVEIGPGRAAITKKLVDSGANVIGIELDREFAPMLQRQFAAEENFTVIEADALSVNYRDLAPAGEKLRVVANLPYYISTAILQRFIEFSDSFADLTLMFQLEVVERITAEPGTSERGFLTVMNDAFFESTKLFEIPPAAFRPIPKVDSAVVHLRPRDEDLPPLPLFRTIASAAFAQKRKTILNNLKAVDPNAKELLLAAGIDPTRRAESLTRIEWLSLTNTFQAAA